MAAHVLLLLSRSYRSELESVLPKAATIWLDAPYDEEQILNVLFATNSGTTFDGELLQRFLRGALVHPRGSLLRVWAQMNNLLKQRAPIPLDVMRTCMNVLPEQWWARGRWTGSMHSCQQRVVANGSPIIRRIGQHSFSDQKESISVCLVIHGNTKVTLNVQP